MSISKNRVNLIGYLGQDPKIEKTKNNDEFAILSVATSDYYKDKEGNAQQATQWHNVVIFQSNSVKFLKEYAKKGDLVDIEGSLEKFKSTDDSGQEYHNVSVVVKSPRHSIQLDKQSKSQENNSNNNDEKKPTKKAKS